MWALARPASSRAHPFVKQLLDEAIARRILDKELCYRTGFAASTLRNWRYGNAQPSIGAVEALANALGYKLEITPCEQSQRFPLPAASLRSLPPSG
jgi:transcriptional regulator with XRE-family HTH domain